MNIHRHFNEKVYSPKKRQAVIDKLESAYGHMGYRLNETPLLITPEFRDEMVDAAKVIWGQLTSPDYLKRAEKAVPKAFRKGGEKGKPVFFTIDFAVTEDETGKLRPKVVELQAGSSMLAFTEEMAQAFKDEYGLGDRYQHLFNGKTRKQYIDRLREVIVGNHAPKNVALMDAFPEKQKFNMDFVATAKLLGIKVVGIEKAIRHGKGLYYKDGKGETHIERIYNRALPEEIGTLPQEAQDNYTTPGDAEWVGHPAWHQRISKFSLPFINHPAVPKSWRLSDVASYPKDLENYVMKPLFSFSGHGFKFDITKEDLDAVPKKDRKKWLLMEKIHYKPVVPAPDGRLSKAEARVMFVATPDGNIEPMIMWARFTRGNLVSVGQNLEPGTGAGPVFVVDQKKQSHHPHQKHQKRHKQHSL